MKPGYYLDVGYDIAVLYPDGSCEFYIEFMNRYMLLTKPHESLLLDYICDLDCTDAGSLLHDGPAYLDAQE